MSPKDILSLYIDDAKKELIELETIRWPSDRNQLISQIASLRKFIDNETKVIRKLQV